MCDWLLYLMPFVPDWLLYSLPFVPLVTRGCVCVRYWKAAQRSIPHEALEQTEHRSTYLVLAGFAFTGLLGISAFLGPLKLSLWLPFYFLFCGFLAFLATANLQGYKAHHWQDQLSSALGESGTLSLIVSVIGLLPIGTINKNYLCLMAFVAVAVWGVDHFVRLLIDKSILKNLPLEEAEETTEENIFTITISCCWERNHNDDGQEQERE